MFIKKVLVYIGDVIISSLEKVSKALGKEVPPKGSPRQTNGKVGEVEVKEIANKDINQQGMRDLSKTAKHKYEPLTSLDINKINDFDDMLKAMSKTSFGGRKIGEAAEVLYEMFTNKNCFKVLTVSGAMTPAKMGLLICEMIDKGFVDVVISTGALMSHGLVESLGMQHFKYKEGATSKEDTQLYYDGYDRIYDTLEVEQNLDDAADIVKPILEKEFSEGASLCSHKITRAIGKYLAETFEESGILRQAYLKNVPVFIPAFTDSELGLDFGIYLKEFARDGKKPYTYDAYLDLEKYTKLIAGKETLGIFTIGGGVPRNWAQQVGPYLDMIGRKLHGKEILRRFKYGVRICPEPVNWGGLSGCTYSEGISWGKFVPPHEGGRFAEVLEDATVAWPLLLKGVIQRIEKNKTQG